MTPTAFAATAFDRPVPRLAVPGTVSSGTRPEVQLVDGVTRGADVLGRFETNPGLLAVKLTPVRGQVRVTVGLAADADTATWWERRVPEHVTPRSPYGPRLLAIRSQGATRGGVVLARRPEDFGWRARTRISFELGRDELPDDGFLVVEAVGVHPSAPDWATPVAAHGAVGVRLDTVEVSPVTDRTWSARPGVCLDGAACARLGLVGTGGGAGYASAVDVRAGFFVTHKPPGTPGPVTWTLRPRLVSAARPDPVPTATGPVLPRPGAGQAPPTVRDKAFAVARHELSALDARVRRKVRHAATRGLRRARHPVDDSRAPRLTTDLVERGLVHAVLVPLGSAEQVHCRVTAGSAGLVLVTCAEPPEGPAVVYVGAPSAGPRLRWRLVSARFGAVGT